jgi:hypothetical protein
MMNANLKPASLTDSERARIRKELYEEKKKDLQFITEAINEAGAVTASIIRKGFESGDANIFMMGCQHAVMNYIESELAEDAERELLASKDVNGKRYLEA